MDGPPSRISIRVVVPDPGRSGVDVETRILVDDRPVVAEAFTDGPAASPEDLLGPDGPLHAHVVPHEVRLAVADCAEGCCGALHVTVERRGDRVVWRDWRNPDDPDVALPTFTFDAAGYDAEIIRAGSDHTWEWHERTVARHVRRRLAAEPELMTRWDCHPIWTAARPGDRERVDVSYLLSGASGDPFLQFVAVLGVPPGDPAVVADDLVRACARTTRAGRTG
ncbi:hypothetical protein AB0H28_05920 [Micromonospora sp. NPDC050980]|uniref:hypothetical protein n=1 Tax=Micromonospora sp. NPDC050980 TaxID=3155161 RepID=UPI0033CB3193